MKKLSFILILLALVQCAWAQKQVQAPLIILEECPINFNEKGEPDFIIHKNAKGNKIEKVVAPIDLNSLSDKKVAQLIDTKTKKIESITIFKDNAANVIWGRHGKNGVIEIKLKNPKSFKKWGAGDIITGTVVEWDNPRIPITHAVVEEVTKDGHVIGQTTTNEWGLFQLKLVDPKNSIQITHNDYKLYGPYPTNWVNYLCYMTKNH